MYDLQYGLPHAKAMSVVGDFNEWDYEQHKMLQVTEGEFGPYLYRILKKRNI
ncbi:hypothetical protein ACT7DP_11265 [Bacillus paranthracis]